MLGFAGHEVADEDAARAAERQRGAVRRDDGADAGTGGTGRAAPCPEGAGGRARLVRGERQGAAEGGEAGEAEERATVHQ